MQTETTWLAEMFNVQLIVLNNSSNEEIQDCKATLTVDGKVVRQNGKNESGMVLASMEGAEQNPTIDLGTIGVNSSASCNWIAVGKSEGLYYFGADVTGNQVSVKDSSISSRINESFCAMTPVRVMGGSALHLYIMGKSYTTSPDYVLVQYALINVSDINLYDVQFKAGRGTTYSVGSKDDILDKNNNIIQSKLTEERISVKDGEVRSVKVMGPGDAIIVSQNVYVGGQYAGMEFYVQNVITKQLAGNAALTTASKFTFVASRNEKSVEENKNVHKSSSADPVNMLTGAYTYERSDATIKGGKDFSLTRTYGSSTGTDGLYGYGWKDNYMYFLEVTETGDMVMNFPSGGRAYFTKLEDGSFASAPGSELMLEVTRKNNSKGNVVVVEGSENKEGIPKYVDLDFTGATVSTLDGTVYTFNNDMKVSKMVELDGYTTSYSYNGDKNVSKVSTVTGSASFEYNKDKHISKVTMSSGEVVNYSYDDNGYLHKVTNAEGDSMFYTYDENGYITKVTDFLGNESVTNEYDEYGRVTKQYVQGEGTFKFSYDVENKENKCTGPNGYVHTIKYDSTYRIIEDTENGTKKYSYDDNSWLTEESDAEGNKTTYDYDSFGRITEIKYHDANAKTNHTEKFTYNSKGKMIENIGKTGAKTSFFYDEKNRLKSLKDNNGRELNYAYDSTGNVICEVHSDGGIKSYTYDTAGRKTSETDENRNVTVYEYDKAGRTLSVTGSDGSRISYTYSSAGKLLSETDAEGKTKKYNVNANGYTTAVIYPDGSREETYYNEQNKSTVSVNRLGKASFYTYDEAGKVKTFKNESGHTTSYEYDANGNVTSVSDASGQQWTYQYDKNGNVTQVTNPVKGVTKATYNADGKVLTQTDENGATSTYTYDGVGNVLTVTDALGNKTSYSYNEVNDLTEVKEANGAITDYTYDKMHRVIAETDPLGNTKSYTYDYKGQLKSETDAKGSTTSYEYDSAGRVILVKDAQENITEYSYDSTGRLLSITKPNGGTITYTYNDGDTPTSMVDERGHRTVYSYTPTGLLKKITDREGNTTTYSHNNQGSVSKITYPDSSWIKYEYDELERVKKSTTSDEREITYTYDALGRLHTETDALGNKKTYSYDAVGNVTGIKESGGYTTTYSYDAKGQLLSEKSTNSGTTKYEYDKRGNITHATDANGNKTTYSYDQDSRIKSETDPLGNSKSYTYDANGNVTEIKDEEGHITKNEYDKLSRLIKTTNAAGETTEYEYDSMGNVVKEIRGDGKSREYTYDLSGNLTSETDYRGKKTAYTYDCENHLNSISRGDYREQYQRDLLGRITKKSYSDGSGEEYTYDVHGNIICYKDRNGNETSYSYDANDNMIKSVDAEGGITEYGYDAKGHVTRQTVYRDIPYSGKIQKENTYYIYNSLGKPVMKTDEVGTTTYEYDLNGNLIKETNRNNKQEKTYEYDALNRLISKNEDGKKTTYEYNKTSAVTAVVSKDNDIRYVRDSLDRITETTQNGKVTTYEYNGVGQQSKVVYPDNTENNKTFNENGALKKSISESGTVEYGFDDNNNISYKITKNKNAAGENSLEEREDYTYDENGRMLSSIYSNGKKSIVTDEYQYDFNGNITSHIERDVKSEKQVSHTYTYDGLNRIKSETKEKDNQVSSTEYLYDTAGNLVRECTDGNPILYTYNNANQLIKKLNNTESSTYSYDGNGALSAERDGISGRLKKSYANDANGKMIQVTNYQYEISPRIVTETTQTTDRKLDDNGYVVEEAHSHGGSKTVSGMTLITPNLGKGETKKYTYDYTGEIPQLLENDSSKGTTVDYVYGHGKTGVVVTNPNADDGEDSTEGFRRSYHLSTDKNGTTKFATNQKGEVVGKTTYGTWADVESVEKIRISDTIDVDVTSSYTGYVYDAEQNLWSAGERVYDSQNRHFLSLDPEPGNVYEKMRVNAYVYAGNNPVTYMDYNGRWYGEEVIKKAGDIATDVVGAAVCGGLGVVGAVGAWIYDNREMISETYDKVDCILKSEEGLKAQEIILGALGLSVAILVTAGTGGAILPVLAEVAGGIALGAAIEAGAHTYGQVKSGNEIDLNELGEHALDGAIDGFAFSGLGAAGKAFARMAGWVKVGEGTAKYAKGADAAAGSADDVARIGGSGKSISYTDYDNIYQNSIHNPGKDKVMLGKYDGGGPTSYITKAGDDYTYFDLGDKWATTQGKYGYSDKDMFKLFNEPFLDDGINEGKIFRFSHNPIGDTGALGMEYEYLFNNGYRWNEKMMAMIPH